MNMAALISSILVLIGAVFMLAAIIQGKQTTDAVPRAMLLRWRVMIILMLFFLAGYLLFVVVLTSGIRFPTDLITGTVFLFGALFVLIVINLSRETIRKISATEKALLRLNEELELKVQERTRQLLEAQEKLVRKEQLAVIGRLAEGMSHELRNTLGVISNAVYYLKTVTTEANETVKEYLDIIKDEVVNSLRIINALLDSSGEKMPSAATIMVDELIHQSLGVCVISENIVVRVDIPDRLGAVFIDPLQMRQVFHHLIANALQSMPAGGSLAIHAEEDREARALRISITDTGEGISPDNMKKLFQPLFTTRARGIGLGLALSRKLTEANGGRLEVESESGKGTTFTVILPFERE